MRTYESLAQFGLAHNLTFSKHHIVKWFPSLCQAIREEQEKCMQVDLTNERGEYGPYLLKLSPEKIALVCLSELMKQVTRMATNRDEDDTSLSYYIVSKIMFSCIGKSVC
jgi:DNA-directed RNA polymerase